MAAEEHIAALRNIIQATEQRRDMETLYAIIVELRRRSYGVEHVPRLSSCGRGGGGLSSEIISKNLQTRVCGIKDHADEVCAICCDAFCQGKEITKRTIGVLKCGHAYHVNCIKQWRLKKNLCPICRARGLERT